MSARVSIAVLALGVTLAGPLSASDVGYIYGRVETRNGGTYEGQLRWGKEESFWDDLFNASKFDNEHLSQVDSRTLRRIRNRKSMGLDFLGIRDWSFDHVFAIRFGDLKRIEVRRQNDFVVEFRNGQEMRLKDGSNDVGATVTVVDPRRGKHELEWNSIRTIEFMNTPAKLTDKLGEPIYGKVKSGRYDFTGRIQWDNDETLTSDKLEGRDRDGRVAIPFADIESIRKSRNGSLVTLRSGEELYVTGSNDVNHENRGVVVIVPRVGTVKIGWDDFDEVTFSRAPSSGRAYSDYATGRDLMGTVVTRNARYDGRIVYDLDEAWDFELLQGKNGATEYLIPFRDIERIHPEGRRRATVELKMGLKIELEDSQDVTRRNDGILIFEGDTEPAYVAWQDVTEVRFR